MSSDASQIPRVLDRPVLEALRRGGKIVVLHGPRQVGKTTLLDWIAQRWTGRIERLSGDFLDDRELLRPERTKIAALVEGLDALFVDEAQLIPDVGRSLKVIHDHYPDVRVLATGSSTLDLGRATGEPLTGRQIRFTLFPLAYSELDPRPTQRLKIFDHAMLYGTYPEVWSLQSRDEKIAHLRQLASDDLLKDLFAQVDLNRTKLTQVLKLLALQVGCEVSLNEIARQVQMDTKTIARYLDLLEASFVIVRIGGFSRNLRKEVAKARKVYFVDLGLRNALLSSFQPLDQRSDAGNLWENFNAIQRITRRSYERSAAEFHFWRTYDQKELDLVEVEDERVSAFEFKWSRGKAKIPRLWNETYPDSPARIIDRESAHEFLNLPTWPEALSG